ncbi:MAG: type IV secretion system DNA-binding domain-containing protein [Candidatus Gracilibacteria bacterium]|nr:type IV secretion system DNA-binding domain-containing protein [Candidatus Gracilibacteria bacterium]
MNYWLYTGAIAVAGLLFILLAAWLSGRKHLRSKEKGTLLQIKVSKLNEKGPLAADKMLASLHGILKEGNYFQQHASNQEHFSFEIVSLEQNIYFFVWCPEHLKKFVAGQIYAQYPEIEITEVAEDYMQNLKAQSIGVASVTQDSHYVLPIKLFEEFEEVIKKQALDSLSAITEAMGKLDNPEEQVWIQILACPVKDRWWQKTCEAVISKLREGKKVFFRENAYVLVVVNPIYKTLLLPFIFIWKLLSGIFNLASNSEESNEQRGKGADDIDETYIKAIIEKNSSLGYRVEIRFLYANKNKLSKETIRNKLRTVAGSFKQFNTVNFNGFELNFLDSKKYYSLFQQREFSEEGMILNTKELASIFHLPNILVATPNIVWVTSKKLEPPTGLPTPSNSELEDLTILGETNFRASRKEFGIKLDDRRRHIYIIGKTGMGKSTLLQNMIISDIRAGSGVAVVDPHGELAEDILKAIPANRTNDVIIFDPSDTEFPVALNLLEGVSQDQRSIVASGLVSIFKRIYGESWGPRLEHVLRNTILALLEYPNSSMLGIMRILTDADYREKVVASVTDPVVKSFWEDEFANFPARELPMVISPIQNKVGQFLSSSIVRNIVGQAKSTISIREAMDNRKILIVNLSKGKIGEDNSSLLGSMIITKFQLDAMSRANIPAEQRIDFNLYVDEFQNFATESFATILSEARKYKLNLTMANQYIAQMSDEVREAVFGNVGTLIAFQTGYDDAEYLTKQFGETVIEKDITGLSKFTIYLQLLVDGIPSLPFSANTLPPIKTSEDADRITKITKVSREHYGTIKEQVEDKITRWSKREERKGSFKTGSKEAKKTVHKPRTPKIDPNSLQKGQIITGQITGMTNFGLFFEHQGVEGLVHKSALPDKKWCKEKKSPYKTGDSIELEIQEVKDSKIVAKLTENELKNKHNQGL